MRFYQNKKNGEFSQVE